MFFLTLTPKKVVLYRGQSLFLALVAKVAFDGSHSVQSKVIVETAEPEEIEVL